MAFYTGSVAAKDLFTTILNCVIAVQPGETVSWWKKESSLDSDGVYTSSGSTGVERIVVVLKDGTIGQNIITGIARDYTPGAINTAGAFDTVSSSNLNYFTAAQNQNTIIAYDVAVTKDRVIIHVQGDKLISGWQNSVSYIGMPLRYDVTDKKCVARAQTENSAYTNALMLVQNAVAVTNSSYTWYSIAAPSSPSWGNNYFLETFHFGFTNEGLRGEIDGLYGILETGLVDGDEIDVAGQRYKIVIRTANGNNAFPRTALAIKKA
jgi:hypothetical protein